MNIEEKSKKKKESKLSKTLWTITLTIAFIWTGVFFFEYLHIKNGNKPRLCVNKEIRDKTIGTVEVCTGLGWKVYVYDTEIIKGQEFGQFWIEERESLEQ